ncbi:hypothetical protein [Propionimicrobium sp. PCR01-08-3]|uniref:hypothetical protein n=1 Tax=Propionimicrobium sp. PCR01-08-3 TaxID=3052086 RepID=UPI00255C3E26|nr:hypothetical protein [Propionimicrobium sp. PCR01-08-3]WIY81386.1 hypothetical protein QQ658_07445 [Propionimicrobium sp. PCR01-08-3]WIY81773.1 hypothetical protein QQ658_09585 [Propionimicrobium sp. PCR01-08-3]
MSDYILIELRRIADALETIAKEYAPDPKPLPPLPPMPRSVRRSKPLLPERW